MVISPSSISRSLRHLLNSRCSHQTSIARNRLFHDKVLVANRGEIACRILRTCSALDIPTVAIYSPADEHSLHARSATEAYHIGSGSAPSESYLRQEEVIDIALRSGATAIHPGYGFLSENADFSQMCQDLGIVFVGPPPAAILAMGSKQTAKTMMEDAGVPVIPGYSGINQDPLFLLEQAKEMGFPVLIKAWHGGGGKGMRLVTSAEDFFSSLSTCQNEAQASFGDPSVLLEKYLINPRHIEVQVVCDSWGNAVHLYERDCSLQRRHQKIIEEAPASDLNPQLRNKLGDLGKKAAQAVGYVNAGTVEFLLDPRTSEVYYCETNTRLQVEHPITESITGIDLVEWQLRIAAGQALPLQQHEIECNGHALEARIYAENPTRGFLPATGTVWYHDPPAAMNAGLNEHGVRVDSGIASGQQVGVYYDPMISKLIVHGRDRPSAISMLINALKSYRISGVATNIDFLIVCAQHEVFKRAGAVTTGFLDDTGIVHQIQQTNEHSLPSPIAQAVGSLAATLLLEQRIENPEDWKNSKKWSPWSSHSGSWRMGGKTGRARRELVLAEGGIIECISNHDGSLDVIAGNNHDGHHTSMTIHVAGSFHQDGTMDVVIDRARRLKIKVATQQSQEWIRLRLWPERFESEYAWQLDIRHPLYPKSDHGSVIGSGQGIIKSPMPGKISRTNFAVGDMVQQGDVVVVMEAMKMEHSIKAPFEGKLIELTCKPNTVVEDGATLFLVDEVGSDES